MNKRSLAKPRITIPRVVRNPDDRVISDPVDRRQGTEPRADQRRKNPTERRQNGWDLQAFLALPPEAAAKVGGERRQVPDPRQNMEDQRKGEQRKNPAISGVRAKVRLTYGQKRVQEEQARQEESTRKPTEGPEPFPSRAVMERHRQEQQAAANQTPGEKLPPGYKMIDGQLRYSPDRSNIPVQQVPVSGSSGWAEFKIRFKDKYPGLVNWWQGVRKWWNDLVHPKQ